MPTVEASMSSKMVQCDVSRFGFFNILSIMHDQTVDGSAMCNVLVNLLHGCAKNLDKLNSARTHTRTDRSLAGLSQGFTPNIPHFHYLFRFELAHAGFGAWIQRGPVQKVYLLLVAPFEQRKPGPSHRINTESNKTGQAGHFRAKHALCRPEQFWGGSEKAPPEGH
jgi:hypothetical protein